MKVFDKNYKTIWEKPNSEKLALQYIDQKRLPFSFDIIETDRYEVLVESIKDMTLRGAPLIGVSGAYSLCLAIQELMYNNVEFPQKTIADIAEKISKARPTAVNLSWAVSEVIKSLDFGSGIEEIFKQALAITQNIYQNEIENCRKIGEFGRDLLLDISEKKKSKKINILTHCNAGWLATIDYGTALAPIYAARDSGLEISVWVDETRPRNQGAKLTAFELLHENINHTVIADNTGGHLMQHGLVDLVIVGADRVSRQGDVCNKIGTYLKALAAKDNLVPFYAAVPMSSFDLSIGDGVREIEIEERSPDEVLFFEGVEKNRFYEIRTAPEGSPAANYGFDVTPARLVSGIITENGIIQAQESEICNLFKTNIV